MSLASGVFAHDFIVVVNMDTDVQGYNWATRVRLERFSARNLERFVSRFMFEASAFEGSNPMPHVGFRVLLAAKRGSYTPDVSKP